MATEKDPYCCLSEKMGASLQGFDRGWITCAESFRYMTRALSKEEALAVMDEVIKEHKQRCATQA